jgi:hypothetical protein
MSLFRSRVTSSRSHERLQTVGQTAVTLSSSSATCTLKGGWNAVSVSIPVQIFMQRCLYLGRGRLSDQQMFPTALLECCGRRSWLHQTGR